MNQWKLTDSISENLTDSDLESNNIIIILDNIYKLFMRMGCKKAETKIHDSSGV